jgi:hypothetical protein
MSTKYDYEEVRRPHDGSHSPRRWSAKHDLIHNLVPFAHYSVNPWDQLKALQDHLIQLPDTASTWRWRDIDDVSAKLNHAGRIQTLCDIVGAWPIRRDGTLGTLWTNPQYPELDQVEWTPDDPKIEHWLRVTLLGRATMRELERRYNLSQKGVYSAFERRGFTFGVVQAYGRRRLANTVVLTREWTGQSVTEAARRIGMPGRTLREWCNRYSTLAPVPQRPSESGIGASW